MAVSVAYAKGKPITAAESPRSMPNLGQKRRIPAFLVLANPASWEFATEHAAEGGEWLPTIKCLPVRPGVGGATTNGDRTNDSGLRTTLANDGFVDLTHDPRLVAQFGPLVTKTPQQDGGNHYMPPWGELGVVGGKTRKRWDMPLFRDFQRATVAILGPMPAETLEDTTARLRARLSQYRMDRTGGSNIARMIAALEAQLDAMDAAWQRQFGEPVPSPAPKRRKVAADE